MKLVWVVIPLVLIGIVGVQDSFAQIYDLRNYPGEWYVGEGLKEGDYFSYSLCHADYKECTKFQMDFWIKGDKQVGSETKWLAEVVVYDEYEIIVGEMELGKVAPEPIGGSEKLEIYRNVFKSSIVWLSAFPTFELDNGKGTSSWRSPMGPIDGSLVHPSATEIITIPAGTWETIVLSWTTPTISKIWIVDDFPFPIKAKTFTFVSEGIPQTEFEFELLKYEQYVQQSPFEGIVSRPVQEGCDTNLDREINIKKPTNNFQYQIHAFYGPEDPVPGCEMNWLIKFISKFDDTVVLNQVQFDFLVVDDNLTPIRSIAEERGKNFLYSPSGQTLLDFIVHEDPGTANYVIFIYGLAPEGIVPTETDDYLLIPVTISVNDEIITMPPSPIMSPKKQFDSGIEPINIVCKDDLKLVFKISNSHPACVKPETAEKLIQRGWAIDEKEPIIIKTGWFAAECFGYCRGDIELTSEKIVFHSKPHGGSCSAEVYEEISFTEEELQSLIKLVDLEKFNALPDSVGLSGAADGLAHWIEISDGDNIKRITFEKQDVPIEIKDFAIKLIDMSADLRVQYLSSCSD